jgi:hypothetical protein
MSRLTPLQCKTEDDQLVLRIGIECLANASNLSDVFVTYDDEAGDWVRRWRVIDEIQFAKDVVVELTREREDGSSPITDLFEKAFESALDQGSLGVEEI